MKMPWFKLYSDFRNDPKIKRLPVNQRYAFIILLCIASESENRGQISDLDDEDIAFELDMSNEDWQTLRAKFKAKGFIDFGNGIITILNWEKRQSIKPSDLPEATKERKRLQREREAQQLEEMSRHVTPLSRHVTQICHADIDLDKEKDQDQEINIFNRKFQDADFQEISGSENQSIPEPLTQIINQEPVPVLALVKSRAKTRAKSKGDFTLEQFNEFWSISEKQVGEAIAKRAFLKIKGVDFELLLEAWKSHHEHCLLKNGNFEYVKQPRNWLAEERWKDRLGDSLQGKSPAAVKNAVFANNMESRLNNRTQKSC